MPPKAKFTKEEIVKTAFDMTRENGFASVTARGLGQKLGSSSTPVFTVFKNMAEVQKEVRRLALKEFETYVADALNYTPAFKQFGMQMIRFAKEEPQLFRILYLEGFDENQTFDLMFEELGEPAKVCIDVIQKDYGLTHEESRLIFHQTWISTFSICVLLVNKICNFSEEEIMDMLGMGFQGTLMLIKSGQYKRIEVTSDTAKLGGK